MSYPHGSVVAQKMPDNVSDLWSWFGKFDYVKETVFAVIERQTPRPTMIRDFKTKAFRPTILKSTCLLYGSYMELRAMLTAAGIPTEEVLPKVWQKYLNIVPRKKEESDTQWKNRLKLRAMQLHPNLKVTLATADSLLLLEYARRIRGNHE